MKQLQNKEYVASLELSTLAKRKGFNVPTIASWDNKEDFATSIEFTGGLFFTFVDIKNADNLEEAFETFLAPTLNQLIDWLLDSKNILVEITSDTSNFTEVPREWYCKVQGMFYSLSDVVLTKEEKQNKLTITIKALHKVLNDLPDDTFYN